MFTVQIKVKGLYLYLHLGGFRGFGFRAKRLEWDNYMELKGLHSRLRMGYNAT